MNRLVLGISIPLAACSIGGPSQAIEISNFKSGLVCPQKSPTNQNTANGQICFETDTVNITGQSTCIYNDEKQRCTWYGFEFDYKNAASNQVIKCRASSSDKATYGNPDGIEKEDTYKFEYELKLKSGDGHFYNPQYSGFTYSTDGKPVKTEETTCYSDDKELFRFTLELIYPVASD